MIQKKFHWLKLKEDFFKRHEIRVIEAMPNGKEYVLIYLKILVESISHDGRLRFNEEIPYDEHMLGAIFNTHPDIVKGAITLFMKLGLVELWDDKTIYMKQIEKMTGSEVDSAERVRRHRALIAQKQTQETKALQCNTDVTTSNEIETPEYRDKSIEIRDKNNKKSATHKRPVLEFGAFKNVKMTKEEYEKLPDNRDELIDFLDQYIEEKGYKSKNHYLAICRWVITAVEERRQKTAKTKRDDVMPAWVEQEKKRAFTDHPEQEMTKEEREKKILEIKGKLKKEETP